MLIITAFLGYVMPWGQISFWGATVITNLIRAIPYIGEILTYWIWGGFSINNATLTRFFSLHFCTPFLLILLVIFHLTLLHTTGRNNPTGTSCNLDKIPFHPYFTLKDTLGIMLFFLFFLLLVLTAPNYFIDPENFKPANPLRTPTHIQPEWYFLFAYAILRAIPNKLGGVIGLLLSIFILLILPLITNKKFYPLRSYPRIKISFWCLLVIFFTFNLFRG